MGGYDGYEPISSIEKIDLAQDGAQFATLPRDNQLLNPLKNSASVLHQDKIIIVGGWDNKDTSEAVYCYDPKTETCSFLCRLPGRVEGHSLALFGDILFIIGGFDSYGVSDRIIKLNLKTTAATFLADRLLIKRENHTS
jgi:hypothetical protein